MSILLAEAPAAASVAAAAEPAIRLEGVSKRFPVRRGLRAMIQSPRARSYRQVLAGVDLEVRQGEICGLLGPNGAGKTTLLKILSTLVLADSGRARVAGFDVAREPARVRRVLSPVIADERSLDWRLSAPENLRLYARLHGLRGAACRRRVDELIRLVSLEDAGDRMVAAFSSGMRQRLLLARALVCLPKVLLLDEPTRSLDPLAAERFRAFLQNDIAGAHGCTLLVASHSAAEVFGFCDRVAILDRGRVAAVGSPESLSLRFGESRYRIWTRTPLHGSILRLADRNVITTLGAPEDAGDWCVLDVAIQRGPEQAAAVLSALVMEGVEIARFERVPMTLAALITRVVGASSLPEAADA